MGNGLCSAFGNWKTMNVNTIGLWQMLVRQPLRNLQRWGAFIAAFTSERYKKIYSAIGNCFQIFSSRCKTKGAVGARSWQLGA
jgi:hypothetical protein